MTEDTSFWTFIGAISTLVYSILTIGLIIVTWWYAHAIRMKDKLSEIHDEMEKIVAPIYNNKDNIWFFKHGHPTHGTNHQINIDYEVFWKSIKDNRHYANNQIRQSINNYLDLVKPQSYRNITEPADFSRRKKELLDKIEIRYNEILKEIEYKKSPLLRKILHHFGK